MGVVTCDVRGSVALVEFSRLEQRNALSKALVEELLVTLAGLAGRSDVRAVVLTGGGENFSVGADLKERASLPASRWVEHHGPYEALTGALQAMPQPTIAAVRGFALGGGCELALGCDIVVAGEDARFGQPEAKRGLIPGMGGPQLLLRRVSYGAAAYLLFSGAILDAQQALQWGIATVLAQDPRQRALEIAGEFASASPIAVRGLRRLLRGSQEAFTARYAAELDAWREAVASGDPIEGALAFVQRRTPVFPDR